MHLNGCKHSFPAPRHFEFPVDPPHCLNGHYSRVSAKAGSKVLEPVATCINRNAQLADAAGYWLKMHFGVSAKPY
jgi:hypothetical protein